MFYQLKDIDDSEAQILISKSKSDRSECDEKNGWFVGGLDAKLRNILTDRIKKYCIDSEGDTMSMISAATAPSTIGDSILFEDDQGQDIFDEDLEETEEDVDDTEAEADPQGGISTTKKVKLSQS